MIHGLFTLPAVTRRQKKHDILLLFYSHLKQIQNAKRKRR